jgi:hypothetical protein
VGILDKVKSLIGRNEEKVDDAIDKGADFADDKTDSKYTDKIESGADKAHDVADDLGNKDGK